MASNLTESKTCSTCPDSINPNVAEMYCKECKTFLCMQCFKIHELIPVCQDHTFISSGKALSMIEKETDRNKSVKDMKNIKKVLKKHSTSEKMVQRIHMSRDPWTVRNMQCSFCDVMGKLKHVKTIENLEYEPYRLGVVNEHIWIRQKTNLKYTKFALFDNYLNKVTELKLKDICQANTAQQVNADDIMIGTGSGLHVVDTEGRCPYKIMDGDFSDISANNNGEVAAMEYKQNKVVFLRKKHDVWQIQRHISFNNKDQDFKTLLLCDRNVVFVAVNCSARILKISKTTGEILQQYGDSSVTSQLGEFIGPFASGIDASNCVVVSDFGNGRFQVLHPDGKWEEIKVKGINWIVDAIVFEDLVYILSVEPKTLGGLNYKLSCYAISST